MASDAQEALENENLEIQLLLEGIYRKYGYDFRSYAQASVKRRILRRLAASGLGNVSEMLHAALYDQTFFETLLRDLSISVTEMFRDPSFYRAFREKVLPLLSTEPFIKIWHAGCATGEEVYSMAILLHEAGLYQRSRIYGTDMNEAALVEAREGIFPADRVKEYTASYQAAGGVESFGDYYVAHHGAVIMDRSLKENVVFADHNLVTDSAFGEVHAVVCRNVLIYFNQELQDRALALFRESLSEGGFLCLGTKESLYFSQCEDDFETFVPGQKIFRKRRRGGDRSDTKRS
jgi:chemotaxis protein methyltransferase CheR